MKNLKNKIAIVTGASDGIGREIAIALGKAGLHVALIGRDTNRLQETLAMMKDGKSRIYGCDLRNLKELKKVVGNILKDFGQVGVLINNAGIWQKVAPLDEIDEETIDDVLQTNLVSLIHLTRLMLPNLKKQPEAAIINIVSKSGKVAQTGQSVYTASKWGARGFTEVMKEELKNTSVRVAGIYQSGIHTHLFEKAGDTMPVEKYTDPKDLADVIVFMLSRPDKLWMNEVAINY